MKAAVAGGTGFIGKALAAALRTRADEVVLLRRDREAWAGLVDGCDAVVNLAGENVAAGRWTDARKAALRESRLETTRAIVQIIRGAKSPPRVLVNASAVGYYGDGRDRELSEDAPPGRDFLAELCRAWEAEALKARALGARVALTRFGVVLGPGGGALPRMALPFSLFVGGPLGSGRQWLPWVHRDDAVGAVLFALDTPSFSGPANVVAPQAARNADFSRALGRALHRPSWLPAPAFALRLALGELGEMLLGGQRAVPRALQAAGYAFKHPELDEALRSALAAP